MGDALFSRIDAFLAMDIDRKDRRLCALGELYKAILPLTFTNAVKIGSGDFSGGKEYNSLFQLQGLINFIETLFGEFAAKVINRDQLIFKLEKL